MNPRSITASNQILSRRSIRTDPPPGLWTGRKKWVRQAAAVACASER